LHRDVLQHPPAAQPQRWAASGRVRKATINLRLRGVYRSRGDSVEPSSLQARVHLNEMFSHTITVQLIPSFALGQQGVDGLSDCGDAWLADAEILPEIRIIKVIQ